MNADVLRILFQFHNNYWTFLKGRTSASTIRTREQLNSFKKLNNKNFISITEAFDFIYRMIWFHINKL
jgi:hypothetical protein